MRSLFQVSATPIFVFWAFLTLAYPLLVWPLTPSREASYGLKLILAVGALLVGASACLWQYRHLTLGHILLRGSSYVLRQPGLLLAVTYAGWTLFASVWSPLPALSFTGSPDDYTDGALAEVVFAGLFCLAYLSAWKYPRPTLSGVTSGLLLAGVLLTLGALVEIFTSRGIYYPVALVNLPLVTFPGKGHLAGFLTFVSPLAWGNPFLALLLGLGLGLTYTRAAFLGSFLVWAWAFRLPLSRRSLVLAGAALCGGLLLGLGLASSKGTSGGKELGSSTSLESRWLLWKAVLRGVQERPLTGFGGGVFHLYSPKFLSEEDLARLVRLESGYKLLERKGLALLVEDEKGRRILLRLSGLKAHNEVLDKAVTWGIPGAALFLALVLGGVVRGLSGSPNTIRMVLALVAYALFLGLWYLPPEAGGPFWAVLGAIWGANTGEPGGSPVKGHS